MPDKDTLAPLSSQLMSQMRAGMRRKGRLWHDDHLSGEGWRGYDDQTSIGFPLLAKAFLTAALSVVVVLDFV
ncbi:MAG: hypothetical protein JW748_09710 [Anaerolineales bacterium]|nr:hypothetical protein [Anaerolineales bacterium]